jgi:hypothetical protein
VPLLLLALVLLLAVALLPLLFVVLLPLSLVQRYRAGTARRQARGWVLALNLVSLAVSTALFLAAATITTLWVPRALPYAALGLLGGCLLGLLGLAASRWEEAPGSLHYTPNRWLVLSLVTVVAGRIAYGLWRGWHAWRAAPADASWVAALGVAPSLAAGAIVLGYYLTYWAGVRRRLQQGRSRGS